MVQCVLTAPAPAPPVTVLEAVPELTVWTVVGMATPAAVVIFVSGRTGKSIVQSRLTRAVGDAIGDDGGSSSGIGRAVRVEAVLVGTVTNAVTEVGVGAQAVGLVGRADGAVETISLGEQPVDAVLLLWGQYVYATGHVLQRWEDI